MSWRDATTGASSLTADRDDFVRNGDRYTIIGPHPLGGLTVTTRHGTTAPIPARYITEGHLDIAYASTIHAAQGATVDETHTLTRPPWVPTPSTSP